MSGNFKIRSNLWGRFCSNLPLCNSCFSSCIIIQLGCSTIPRNLHSWQMLVIAFDMLNILQQTLPLAMHQTRIISLLQRWCCKDVAPFHINLQQITVHVLPLHTNYYTLITAYFSLFHHHHYYQSLYIRVRILSYSNCTRVWNI